MTSEAKSAVTITLIILSAAVVALCVRVDELKGAVRSVQDKVMANTTANADQADAIERLLQRVSALEEARDD